MISVHPEIVVVVPEELFEGLLSLSEETLTRLLMIPEERALSTFTTSAKVAVPPGANASIPAVTTSIVPASGEVAVHQKSSPLIFSKETKVVFSGIESVNDTFKASFDELVFVTVI